jgi:hypothetical protein
MKILRRVLLFLLVLVLLAVGAGWYFLDSLVGTAIEKGSTYATGVETKVEGVDASFFSGRFGIDGLSLANPPGFRSEPFLVLGSARAHWQNGTLFSDTIEMDSFVLDGVDVNLERTGSGTNYGKILDHLEKLSSGETEKPPAEKSARKLTIRKIEIKNVRAGLHLSGVPLASGSMEVKIPSIVIDDFRSDGETKEIVAKLTRALLKAILDEVLRLGKDVFPADLLQDLGENLDGLKGTVEERAKEALEGLEGALKDAGGIFDKK